MSKCECCKEVWRECHLKDGLCPCCHDYVQPLQKQLDQLKQLLKEAQTRISELEDKDWFEATIKQLEEQNDRLIQERDSLKQQLAEKDCRIEELEGQFAYECECNRQLVELQKQLEEKQKTIDEINKEFVQAVHDWKALCAEKDKEKTQLTIQKLEKVQKVDQPK